MARKNADMLPERIRLRTYQVGFGDCFLLSFYYARKIEDRDQRHVLIDFGSRTHPKGSPKDLLKLIAADIVKETGGCLDAVVATHRHLDHINGFATNKSGKGTGDMIRNLKPKLVVQPWTEAPDLQPDATGPAAKKQAKKSSKARAKDLAKKSFVAALRSMDTTAEIVSGAVKGLSNRTGSADGGRECGPELARLSFLGEKDLTNLSAVENLMNMAKNQYVAFGDDCGLSALLPGVDVQVLGPPTVDEGGDESDITKERSSDPDEFWQLQAAAARHFIAGKAELFPEAEHAAVPPVAKWLITRLKELREDQMQGLVRSLDHQMNNTSVILLFTIGEKKLLFPGDAQLEDWGYALFDAPKDRVAQIEKDLADVELYKVGHHGSRNATPKTLWNLFQRRSTKPTPKRLKTVMSTQAGTFGKSADAKVPSRILLKELQGKSDLFSTQQLKGKVFCHDIDL